MEGQLEVRRLRALVKLLEEENTKLRDRIDIRLGYKFINYENQSSDNCMLKVFHDDIVVGTIKCIERNSLKITLHLSSQESFKLLPSEPACGRVHMMFHNDKATISHDYRRSTVHIGALGFIGIHVTRKDFIRLIEDLMRKWPECVERVAYVKN